MTRLRNLVLRLLTREVELAHFSDGNVYIVGTHAIPEKPVGIVRKNLTARVWRWKRASHG